MGWKDQEPSRRKARLICSNQDLYVLVGNVFPTHVASLVESRVIKQLRAERVPPRALAETPPGKRPARTSSRLH